MTPQDNADVIRSLYDAFNLKDAAKAQEISASGALIELLPFGLRLTPYEVFRNWAQAFPDAKVQLRSIIASEDRVVCELIGRGTHTGPLRGPEGVLPPTGKRIELELCEVYVMQFGKIVSGRSYFDGASLVRQLGIGAQPMAQAEAAKEPVEVRH
jgi:predicted ester cyclase